MKYMRIGKKLTKKVYHYQYRNRFLPKSSVVSHSCIPLESSTVVSRYRSRSSPFHVSHTLADLHLGNVLLCLLEIDQFSRADFLKYLGPPCKQYLLNDSDRSPVAPSPHLPEYVVASSARVELFIYCLQNAKSPTQSSSRSAISEKAFSGTWNPRPLSLSKGNYTYRASSPHPKSYFTTG